MEPKPKSVRAEIKALSLEQKLQLGKFYVKYKGQGSYVLVDTTNAIRSRWGNLDQINKDTEFALENGTLPPASGERW